MKKGICGLYILQMPFLALFFYAFLFHNASNYVKLENRYRYCLNSNIELRENRIIMKQIMTELIRVSILIIVCCLSVITVTAEEVIIESITSEEICPWDNRPLIQSTTYEDEYLGAVKLGALIMPELAGANEETLYEEAAKCVVRIVMGQYAGSGLIWSMEEEGMVIAANKHLLREAAYGTVTFSNEMVLPAEILAFSQEYDLGFLFIPREELTSELLRDCYGVRRIQMVSEKAGEQIEEKLENQNIMQIASSQQAAADCYKGSVKGISFVPEFQVFLLETACYSKAGMSGGGVFDEKGYLLGMIAGGNVELEASVRESEITYSIPAWQIEEEYRQLRITEQ